MSHKSTRYYNSKRYQKTLDCRNGKYKMYCVQCEEDVSPDVVSGKVIYPYRKDLYGLVLFQCPNCKNYASEHARVIPTRTIRKFRQKIHSIIDPLWRSGVVTRSWVYRNMSKAIGKDFHSGNIRSDEEAITAYMAARKLALEVSLRGLNATNKVNSKGSRNGKQTVRRRGRNADHLRYSRK